MTKKLYYAEVVTTLVFYARDPEGARRAAKHYASEEYVRDIKKVEVLTKDNVPEDWKHAYPYGGNGTAKIIDILNSKEASSSY